MGDIVADNDFHAFPTSSVDGFTQHGMTMRDWFAGQALMGMLHQGYTPKGKYEQLGFDFAKSAYAMADDMLKAREV
jgi:hypothetical protein